MPDWQAVLPAPALRSGDPRGAQAHDRAGVPLPLILVRTGGVLRAYLNRCPHRGVNLDWIPDRFLDADGEHLQCSTHGALFEPATGLCVAGPCAGQRLVALPVREVDGRIEVDPGA